MLRWWVFGLFLLMISCSQESPSEKEGIIDSSPYFPLNIGHDMTYDVWEVVYRNNGNVRDTNSFLLKETITDSYLNEIGEEVFIVDRYTKQREADSWNYVKSWQGLISQNKAIRIEDNRSFIKLRFPIKDADHWDGNALFDASDPILIGGTPIDYYNNWQSKILNESVFNINERRYEAVQCVSLADHENRLELRYGKEVYAANMGLIYKELRILDTQCFDACTEKSWEEKAEKGHIYIQSLRN